MNEIQIAANLLRKSRSVVVFTGAGMSQESGIPTFRDDDGLWNRFPAEEFGNLHSLYTMLQTSPARLLDFLEYNLSTFLAATPNAGHLALREMGKKHNFVVVTQNIDDLHDKTAAGQLYKLHGDLFSMRCLSCGQVLTEQRAVLEQLLRQITHIRQNNIPITTECLLGCAAKCSCGGYLRPDVVLFGEALPEQAWEGAKEALIHAEALLVVGTSAIVHPAAILPQLAYQMDVPIIEINPHPVLKHAAVAITDHAAAGLAALNEALEQTDG